jgi:hypothetical protein
MIATSADSLCRRVASKGVYFQFQETAKIDLLSFECQFAYHMPIILIESPTPLGTYAPLLRKSAAISVDIDEYCLFKNSIYDGI